MPRHDSASCWESSLHFFFLLTRSLRPAFPSLPSHRPSPLLRLHQPFIPVRVLVLLPVLLSLAASVAAQQSCRDINSCDTCTSSTVGGVDCLWCAEGCRGPAGGGTDCSSSCGSGTPSAGATVGGVITALLLCCCCLCCCVGLPLALALGVLCCPLVYASAILACAGILPASMVAWATAKRAERGG